MIAHLQGKLVEKSPTHIVIDCAGVGYHINISLHTYSLLPNTVYYWRVYDDTTTVNKNESSFIYIPTKRDGRRHIFFNSIRTGMKMQVRTAQHGYTSLDKM